MMSGGDWMREQADIAAISETLRDTQRIYMSATAEELISSETVAGTAMPDQSRLQIKVELSGKSVLIKANTQVLPQWVAPTIKSVSELIAQLVYQTHRPVNLNTAKYAIELLPIFMSDESQPPAVTIRDQGEF